LWAEAIRIHGEIEGYVQNLRYCVTELELLGWRPGDDL
jgi:hypothetical protein